MTDSIRHGTVGGVRVVSEFMPGIESASIGIWIDAGSRDEDDSSRGFAHLVEHLIFKGGSTRRAADISRFFDGIGADANAITSREAVVVSTRTLSRHLGDVLDVFGEMLLDPAFRPDDVTAERDVVLEEVAMYLDDPVDVAHEACSRLLFGGHSLALPVLGDPAIISNASVEAIASFHQQHFVPERLVIAVAGNVDHDALEAMVAERFLPFGDASSPATQRAARQQPDQLDPDALHGHVIERPTEQAHVSMGFRSVDMHDDDRFAAVVLDILLGATSSSHLFDRIREQMGLAYSIYSWFTPLSDCGESGIYLGVRPERLETALAAIVDEVTWFSSNEVTTSELERAQQYFEGRTLLSLESTGARSSRLGNATLFDLQQLTPHEVVERVQAVTPHDIKQVAQRTFDPAVMTCSVVTPDVAAATDVLADLAGMQSDVIHLSEATPA